MSGNECALKLLEKLIIASRNLAIEADEFACGEGDRDELEKAIEKVELLTGMRANPCEAQPNEISLADFVKRSVTKF